jgi:hypothetical protein
MHGNQAVKCLLSQGDPYQCEYFRNQISSALTRCLLYIESSDMLEKSIVATFPAYSRFTARQPEHVKNSAPQSSVPQFREDRRPDRTARVSHRTHRSPDSRGYRGGPSHSSLERAAGQAERGSRPFKSFGRPNRSARPAGSRGRFSKNSFSRKNTR